MIFQSHESSKHTLALLIEVKHKKMLLKNSGKMHLTKVTNTHVSSVFWGFSFTLVQQLLLLLTGLQRNERKSEREKHLIHRKVCSKCWFLVSVRKCSSISRDR